MKVLKVAAIVVGAVALVATGIGLAGGIAALGIAGGGIGAGIGSLAVLSSSLIGATGATIVAGALAAAALYDVASLAGAIMPRTTAGGPPTRWKPA